MYNIITLWTYPEEGKPDVYTAEYVNRLYDNLKKHVTLDFNFIALTNRNPIDIKGGVILHPLKTKYRGWWAKLYMFKVFKQAFYLDLDTIIVDNIDALIKHKHKFTMLRNFVTPNNYGSGLMAWNGNYSYLYDEFQGNAHRYIRYYTDKVYKHHKLGDQGFLQDHLKQKPETWQGLFPNNQVVSYKKHCLKKVPDNAKIVCFHGHPRPHEVNWELRR